MGDTNATRTQLLAVFKEVYGEKIAEQPNRTAWIYNFFDKSPKKFGGKYWTEPLLDEGGQAIMSANEDEAMGDAQAESTKEIQIKPRQHYGLIRISGLAIAASKSNLYAFVQAKDFEIKNKTKSLIAQLNAQFYGPGTGALATVLSFATPTVTLDLTNSNTRPCNMNWFRKGLRVDVWTAGFAARRNYGDTTTKSVGFKISSYDKVAGTITLTIGNGNVAVAASAIAVTDIIAFEDAQLTGTWAPTDTAGKQILGLDSLIDDVTNGPQTIQNIDRNVYTIFRANCMRGGVPGTARPLSLDLIQEAIDRSENESGEVADFIVGGFGQRRNYLNLLWYDVRYGPQKLIGGFETLKYNQLDWVVDKDCTRGRLYVGTQEHLKKYVVAPLGILDQAGAQMERQPKTDLYELMIGTYMNLGHDRPNSWTKVVDLIEP